jgi:hypothetical protein
MMAHMAGEPESLQPTHFHTGAIALHFTDQVSAPLAISIAGRDVRQRPAADHEFHV